MFREIIIYFVRRIGFHTYFGQEKFVKNFIFAVYFVNTAINLLLANANLKELGLTYFNGKYRDFT